MVTFGPMRQSQPTVTPAAITQLDSSEEPSPMRAFSSTTTFEPTQVRALITADGWTCALAWRPWRCSAWENNRETLAKASFGLRATRMGFVLFTLPANSPAMIAVAGERNASWSLPTSAANTKHPGCAEVMLAMPEM